MEDDVKLMKYIDERCESGKKNLSDYASLIHNDSTDKISTNVGGIADIGTVLSTLAQAVADIGTQIAELTEKVEGKETK